jgi:hypothetical protein
MAFRPRLARVARRLSDAAGASPLANGPVAFEDAVPRHRVLHKVVVEPADVDTVIYHGGCYDGVGAAWAAWRRVGDKASYHGMQHRQSPPKVRARVRACACVFRAPSVADCEALRRWLARSWRCSTLRCRGA